MESQIIRCSSCTIPLPINGESYFHMCDAKEGEYVKRKEVYYCKPCKDTFLALLHTKEEEKKWLAKIKEVPF